MIFQSLVQITGRVAAANESERAAVHVPSKAIGFILGTRGASIQALAEKTGAQLRVAPGNETTTGSSEHRVRTWKAFFLVRWTYRARPRASHTLLCLVCHLISGEKSVLSTLLAWLCSFVCHGILAAASACGVVEYGVGNVI